MNGFVKYVESPLAHGFPVDIVISATSSQAVPGIRNWQRASNVH